MAAYVIPNFELIGLDVDLNSTYIAGFLFLVLNHFFSLVRYFMENESGLPGGEMEFRDVTGLFLKAADGKCLSQGLLMIIHMDKKLKIWNLTIFSL